MVSNKLGKTICDTMITREPVPNHLPILNRNLVLREGHRVKVQRGDHDNASVILEMEICGMGHFIPPNRCQRTGWGHHHTRHATKRNSPPRPRSIPRGTCLPWPTPPRRRYRYTCWSSSTPNHREGNPLRFRCRRGTSERDTYFPRLSIYRNITLLLGNTRGPGVRYTIVTMCPKKRTAVLSRKSGQKKTPLLVGKEFAIWNITNRLLFFFELSTRRKTLASENP